MIKDKKTDPENFTEGLAIAGFAVGSLLALPSISTIIVLGYTGTFGALPVLFSSILIGAALLGTASIIYGLVKICQISNSKENSNVEATKSREIN
mgnify:CR=1 FL=1